MIDYRINLAKTFVSSAEDRTRFHRSMLLYLAFCTVLVMGAVYYTTRAVIDYLAEKAEQTELIATTTATTGLMPSDLDNPEATAAALEVVTGKMASLRQALKPREKLEPILKNLFSDLPRNVELQHLSANRDKIEFGIIIPATVEDASGPSGKLADTWEKNSLLKTRLASIRPVNGERRTSKYGSVFYVQYECILNK